MLPNTEGSLRNVQRETGSSYPVSKTCCIKDQSHPFLIKHQEKPLWGNNDLLLEQFHIPSPEVSGNQCPALPKLEQVLLNGHKSDQGTVFLSTWFFVFI